MRGSGGGFAVGATTAAAVGSTVVAIGRRQPSEVVAQHTKRRRSSRGRQRS
jgi:hypothetical protein